MGARINNNNRGRGKSFERRVAKFLNWFRVPYSGSAEEYGLADVRDKEDQHQSKYLCECKTMTPRSKTEVNYILQAKWLLGDKGIVTRAKKSGAKFPLLAFTRKGSPATFVTVPIEDFRMYYRAVELCVGEKAYEKSNATDIQKIIKLRWEELKGAENNDNEIEDNCDGN